jgi:hypothetical protein
MERPHSTWGAKVGLLTGYGLTSTSLIREGLLWHGHSGEIRGGISELWYVPAYGIGYFTSINSDNGFDSFRIGQAIRRYLTHGLSPPPLPPQVSLPRCWWRRRVTTRFRTWAIPLLPRSDCGWRHLCSASRPLVTP